MVTCDKENHMIATTEADNVLMFAGIACGSVMLLLIALLGGMPGRIARKRGHPSAEAISILGWVGVFTLGILWLVAFVWAHAGTQTVRIEKPASSIPPDRYRVMGLDYEGKKLIVKVSSASSEEAQSMARKRLAEIHKVEEIT